MPLPLTVSCVSKIQIGFTFVVTAHPGSPGQRAVKRVCVCVVVVVGVVVVVVVDSTARGVVRRSAAERPVLRRRHDRSHQRKLRTSRHRHLPDNARTGAIRRIRLNDPRAAAMRPYH